MNIKRLKGMVSDNKMVTFTRYRRGELIYMTECGFEFPVPISDTGDGEFLSSDRAALYMRYIRKQLKAIDQEHNQ